MTQLWQGTLRIQVLFPVLYRSCRGSLRPGCDAIKGSLRKKP